MYPELNVTIGKVANLPIGDERKSILDTLVGYIQNKRDLNEEIRLNFICTHNSRRSHLGQVWAQTMAFHFDVTNVFCYSGGTEVTAMFPKVGETLSKQGFEVFKISDGANPIYAVKYSESEHPLICFSKTFDDAFNPNSKFAAIMTCSSADEGCPFVAGSDIRLPIRYDDPKAFDGTELMDAKYEERSLQVAAEMFYVFSQIK
jgi:arsenate reductase